MIVNKVQLSSIIGKSESWITDMQKQHDFPIQQKGRGRAGQLYDTAKVIEWMEKRQINYLTGNQGLIDLDEGKRRKMAAEAGLAELELMKEQSKVIEIERIANELGEQLTNFRAKMLSLPSKVAAQVLTADNVAEIRQIIEDGIYEALNEVRGFGNSDPDGELAEGDTDANVQSSEATTEA